MSITLRVQGEHKPERCISCGYELNEHTDHAKLRCPDGSIGTWEPDVDSHADVRLRLETPGDEGEWKRVTVADAHPEVNHSPLGFGWGYHGSAPSDLAFAILRVALEQMPLSKIPAFKDAVPLQTFPGEDAIVEIAKARYIAFRDDTVALVEGQETSFEFIMDIEQWLLGHYSSAAWLSGRTKVA